MDLEYFFAPLDVRQPHINLPVKAAGTEERRIEDVHSVGSSHNDDAGVALKAVHLHQKLVQGLLSFIVPAAQASAALTANSVDLVDEHDGGSGLGGFLKEVTDTACAHAHIQLHKVGAGDGQEGHARFAGNCFGQQGLTGARRPHQQDALWDVCAQSGVLFGVF